MKKAIAIILIIVTVFGSFTAVQAEPKSGTGKSSWQITKDLCKKAGYKKIKLIKTNELSEKKVWRIIQGRKGKNYIVVEKIISYGDGTYHGWYTTPDANKYIIGYNRKIPKGQMVTSYVIWNPKTNTEDDVLHVVDNRMYR